MLRWILLVLGISSLGQALALDTEKTWLRFDGPISELKISPNGRHIALIEEGLGNTSKLELIDLKTKEIFLVSESITENSFQWAPDGYRIFFQELAANLGQIQSQIWAYDASGKTRSKVADLAYIGDYLNVSTLDQKIRLISPKGIFTSQLTYPKSRFAQWQQYGDEGEGSYIASHKIIYWQKRNSTVLRKVKSDTSKVISFILSPDGTSLAWATSAHQIFVSKAGGKPMFVDMGQDPYWHPQSKELIYAGARMVGNKVSSFDLKIANLKGQKRWLTFSQFGSERWPNYLPKAKGFVFTKENTTDLYYREYSLETMAQASDLPKRG